MQYSADGATALGATLDFLYFFSREASGNPAVDMYRATGDDDEDLAGMYEQIFAGRPNNDMSAAFRQPHDPYRVTSRARNSFHSDYWDFVDPEAPNEDQNHHVAGYFWQGFSYGVSNELLVLALKQTGDYPTTRNPGDYQLGVMAAYFGRWWRQNPGYHGGTLKFLLQNNFQTAMNFFGLTNATLP